MTMTFEDLDAWKNARELVNAVYTITRRSSLTKDFGLCGQIQRAAISAMSNVTEGFERQHVAEKLQAYNVARASCGEVRSLLYVIEDNYPQASATLRDTRKLVGGTGSLISGLIASTRRRMVAKTAAILSVMGLIGWAGAYLGH
ncbi:MAG: four helix bundle protein [Verrucomicrobiota bacterium]